MCLHGRMCHILKYVLALLCVVAVVMPVSLHHHVVNITPSTKQAPGYSSIIRNPMDLSKMKGKVESGMYATWNELMVGRIACVVVVVVVVLSS